MTRHVVRDSHPAAGAAEVGHVPAGVPADDLTAPLQSEESGMSNSNDTAKPKHEHIFPYIGGDTNPNAICLVTDCDLTHAEYLEIREYAEVLAPLGEDTGTIPVPMHHALLVVRQALTDGDEPKVIREYVEAVLTAHEFDLEQIDREPNGGPPHKAPRPAPLPDDLPEEIRGVARLINAVEARDTETPEPAPAPDPT